MTSARQRPIFQCAHCQETFGYPVDLDHKGVIVVTCPFCGKRSKVDLDPYRQHSTGVYRGDDTKMMESANNAFDFPTVISTTLTEKKVDD